MESSLNKIAQGNSPTRNREVVSQITSQTHTLKSWPQFFEEIRKGNKRHDLRRRDRNFRVGDILNLREFDPQADAYTGREIFALITYITADDYPCALSEQALNPDFCILSIEVR